MMCVANFKALIAATMLLALSSCVVSEISQSERAASFVQDKENLRGRHDPLLEDDDDEILGAFCVPLQGKLSQQNCQEGLLCVPNHEHEEHGNCLPECGAKVNGRLEKRHDKCPPGLKCLMHSDAALSPLGMFCSKGEELRDASCVAALDADACARGLSCLPTQSRQDDLGRKLFSDYRCKQECSVEQPCGANRQCRYPSYARKERQPAEKHGTMTTCEVKKCANNDPSCPCKKNLGYACENLLQGIDMGFCVRMLGICE